MVYAERLPTKNTVVACLPYFPKYEHGNVGTGSTFSSTPSQTMFYMDKNILKGNLQEESMIDQTFSAKLQ